MNAGTSAIGMLRIAVDKAFRKITEAYAADCRRLAPMIVLVTIHGSCMGCVLRSTHEQAAFRLPANQ
jgi:hypothetical protein